eukprot:239900_1
MERTENARCSYASYTTMTKLMAYSSIFPLSLPSYSRDQRNVNCRGPVNSRIRFGASIWNAFGASPGWKTIFRHTQDLLMKKYQAGTHWGLWFDKEIEGGMFRNISEEKMKLFVDNYKKFNASKKFCNAFTESIGLDQMAWQ